ncbi:MAG: S-layer homology domain-containing protein, partial [Clostridia bacterium]|nr:S-layer homology domain-containing protein [Clostridia bacterium]
MKRTLSLVLAIALVFSMMSTCLVSQAVSFTDINMWAKDNIEYMASYEVLNGYGDGTFKPNNPVKKSEFIKMLNHTFGLDGNAYKTFADVSNQWFANEVQAAAANGYLTTTGSIYSPTVNPEAGLTRQEAAAMLARYLGLEASMYGYLPFADSSSIKSEYVTYVRACYEAGIFKGDNYNKFNPNNTITRAEAISILRRVVGQYTHSATNTASVSGASYYQDSNPQNKSMYVATVKVPNFSLSSCTINGDLLITEGVKNSTITLYNCTVSGNIVLKGAASLKLVNCTVGGIITDTDSIANPTGATSYIEISGATTVNNVNLKTPAVITNSTTSTNYGFNTINTASSGNTLKGLFKKVNVTTSGTTLTLSDGTVVDELNILEGATNTTIQGAGYAKQLNVNAAGAKIQTAPKAYKIKSGLTAVIAGVERRGSSTDAGEYPRLYVNADNRLEIKNLSNVAGTTTYWMIVTRGAAVPTADQIKGSLYNNYSSTAVVERGMFTNTTLGTEYSGYSTKALAVGGYYDVYYFTESYNMPSTIQSKSIYVSSTPTFSYQANATKSYDQATGTYSQAISVTAAAPTTLYVVAVPAGYYTAPVTASQVYDAASDIGTYKTAGMITAVASVGYYGQSNIINLTGMSNINYNIYIVAANSNYGYVPVLSSVNGAGTSVSYSGFAQGFPKILSKDSAKNTGVVAVQAAYANGTAYFTVIPANLTTLPDAATIKDNATYNAVLNAKGYGSVPVYAAQPT